MGEPLIAATVIGSWSFPGWYAKFCGDVARIPTCSAPTTARKRCATPSGWPSTTSSGPGRPHHRRRDAARRFQPRLLRLPGRPPAAPPARHWGPPPTTSASRYRCVAPLAAPRRARHCRRISPAARASPARRSRCRCPGRSRWPAASRAATSTPTATPSTEALIPIVNGEMKALVAAGVDFIQLDEPSFACHPDDARAVPRHDRPHRRGRQGEDQHAHVLRQLPRPGGRPAHYRPLFPHLGRATVQQLALEFASREMAEIELLAEMPAPMEVAVGLVDVKNTWIEPPSWSWPRTSTLITSTRRHLPDCWRHRRRCASCCRKA